jgi:GDPmannose 4,6-dehydratase
MKRRVTINGVILKSVLITGITGQDGHHLTRFLLNKDYKIFGLVNGQKNTNEHSFSTLFPDVTLLRGDLTDFSSLVNVLKISKPKEIYNLGAISFVGMSFMQPELTANVTGLGALRLLEAVRVYGPDSIKIYQASSSEMFGKVREVPQTELTPFHPRSPYGVAKTFAHYSCVNYREAYGMHVSSGILFNHEGEYRGHEFVTRKITSNLAKIKLGKQEKFSLGSLDTRRDWGYAGDYVEAMWLMTQRDIAEDFVIATGKSHSIRDFLETALDIIDLPKDIDRYVDFDQTLVRPSEVETLIGDSSKAKRELNWEAKTDFRKLVEIMIENDLKIESNK